MLAEDLEKARHEASKKRRNLIRSSALALLGCAALVYFLSYYRWVPREQAATIHRPQTSATALPVGHTATARAQAAPAASAQPDDTTAPTQAAAPAEHAPDTATADTRVDNEPPAYLEALRVARAENDAEKEYALLKTLMQQGVTEPELRRRYQQLGQAFAEKRFSHLMSEAGRALDRADTATANKLLRQAAREQSDRSELAILETRIRTLEREQRLAHALRQARQAMRNDAWAQARSALQQAQKEKPDATEIQHQLKLAEQLLALSAQLDQLLARPYALADAQASKQLPPLLQQAETLRTHSPGIGLKAERLARLQQQMNRERPVRIRSDGKTWITVRGIGKVGLTEDRHIHLKPGRYRLEGKREGYRNKLVELLVPYDGDAETQVEVRCDEPL